MMRDTTFWEQYIVHLPLATAFDNAKEKAEMLANVRAFLMVGSLMRPRRLAQLCASEMGLRHVGSYFNIVDDHAIIDREYCIEVVELDAETGESMAIVSHGIGGSGAEIVIKELRALVHWACAYLGRAVDGSLIRAIGRSGTRGTLGDVAYGTVGISTASFNDALDVALPNGALVQRVIEAAERLSIPYALGAGVATQTFWEGQGRAVPAEGDLPTKLERDREVQAQERLWRFIERGILFAEMEDYTVHRVATALRIPSVSAGVVIARRFDAKTGDFIIDYDVDAKKRGELLPAKPIIEAFKAVLKSRA